MQKIAMRTDRHIVDVNFIVTFFNCAFHSITTYPLSFPTHHRCAAVRKSIVVGMRTRRGRSFWTPLTLQTNNSPIITLCKDHTAGLALHSEPPPANRAILFHCRSSLDFEIYSRTVARIRVTPLDALDPVVSYHHIFFEAANLSDL